MKIEPSVVEYWYGLYNGELENEIPNGLGKIFYKCGSTHTGYFKNGLRHGHGISVNQGRDSRIWIYDGEWKNGKKHGYGSWKIYVGGNCNKLTHKLYVNGKNCIKFNLYFFCKVYNMVSTTILNFFEFPKKKKKEKFRTSSPRNKESQHSNIVNTTRFVNKTQVST